MTLPDDIIVYPNHGAGSACGKNMSKETYDTLGHQKETNYALRADMSEDEFVKEVLTGLTTPPQYFPKNARLNKAVVTDIDAIVARGTKELSVDEAQKLVEDGAIILDTRHQNEFVKEHIPGSIFIGLDGQFAPWVGTLIKDIDQKFVVVADYGREEEAVRRLARIGYDYAQGFIPNAVDSWKAAGLETESIQQVTPAELEKLNVESDVDILDVRRKSEYQSEHIIGAENQPLDTIFANLDNLVDKSKTYYTHCAGGYRSVIFTSIAKKYGYNNLIDIAEGFNGIKDNTKMNLSEYVCPTTLL